MHGAKRCFRQVQSVHHILELSGVGRGDVLQAAGIDTVTEVQGVGENLQDHLQLRMVYKVSGVLTLNERASTLFGKARIGLEYALTRSGPMSMAPSQLGVFTRSSPERRRRIWNIMSSRCHSTSLVIRFTLFRPLRQVSAICGPKAEAQCM